jgi:hypothetical protein
VGVHHGTSLTTKQKWEIVASNNLSTSISNYKNNNVIIKNVLEGKKVIFGNKILDVRRLPYVTICRIGSKKS